MFIVFDIGGTKTRIGTTHDFVTLDDVVKFDTPLDYKLGIETIREKIQTITKGIAPQAMAGGIRGPLNHEKTGIVSESKLHDWVGRNIAHDIGSIFFAPVYLENDTALVGLGEVTHGAGKGFDIVAYHTVSTGVGGARYVHEHIDSTSIGFEPGHQVLDIDRTVLGSRLLYSKKLLPEFEQFPIPFTI